MNDHPIPTSNPLDELRRQLMSGNHFAPSSLSAYIIFADELSATETQSVTITLPVVRTAVDCTTWFLTMNSNLTGKPNSPIAGYFPAREASFCLKTRKAPCAEKRFNPDYNFIACRPDCRKLAYQ